MSTFRRFEALDSFRGLFALSIVLYHIRAVSGISEIGFFRGSYILVEFFFVLSGFVLAHSYGFRERPSLRSFVISRTFRLFPLHITMLVVFILLETAKIAASSYGIDFVHRPFAGDKAVHEILPNLLLIQSWTPFTESHSFNYPAWSISIEFYMYIIFFCSLFFQKRIRHLLWLVMVLAMSFLLVREYNIFVEYVPRGLSCFFGGALTYTLYEKAQRKVKWNVYTASLTEISLAVITIIAVSSRPSPGVESVVSSLLFCFVIFIFSFEKGIISLLLKRKVFIYFGKISYSIYMTHAAVIFIFTNCIRILEKIADQEFFSSINGLKYISFHSSFNNSIASLLILLLVLILSHFTYLFVELKGQIAGKEIINSIQQKNRDVFL